jgi:hypothetical protein
MTTQRTEALLKNLILFSLTTMFLSLTASASIMETKFKVTSRYYDKDGSTSKLINTRAFVRYNPEASILSQSAKDDCLVMSGKNDILSLFVKPDIASCISNKTFVITDEDIIVDMFYLPTTWSFFHDRISDVYDIIKDDGKITSKTEKDQGAFGSVRALLRNSIANAAEAQTISLVGRTVFTLKGNGSAKFVIELEPVKTKLLNN